MGRMKEAVMMLLSVSTEDELQEMLKDNSTSEVVKMCIKEELDFRKEKTE